MKDPKVFAEKYEVQSSLVKHFVYYNELSELEVLYKSGKKRKYPNFSKDKFNQILSAPSVGKALLKQVQQSKVEEKPKKSFFQRLFFM